MWINDDSSYALRKKYVWTWGVGRGQRWVERDEHNKMELKPDIKEGMIWQEEKNCESVRIKRWELIRFQLLEAQTSYFLFFKPWLPGPGRVVQLVRVLSWYAKVCGGGRFSIWSGHIQEATNERINKWNNKQVFVSRISPSVSKNYNLKKKPTTQQTVAPSSVGTWIQG